MGKPTTKAQLKKQIQPSALGKQVINTTQNLTKNALRYMVFPSKMEKEAKSILFTTPTPKPKPVAKPKAAPKIKRGAFRA